MGINRLEPFPEIRFRCYDCEHDWVDAPSRFIDADDRPWHPFEYFCDCPLCGAETAQDPRHRGLIKAHAHATGPRTPEGIATVTQNLEGHPTPEEAQRTRFNAMKTGEFSRVAQFYPAKPGKYPHCVGCSYSDDICLEEAPPGHINPQSCLRRAELFVKHQVAFEEGDPRLLLNLRSDTQAGIQALIDDMMFTILADGGPRIKSVEWYHDKEGGFHLAKYTDNETGGQVQIMKLEEHPLLKRLIEFISKNNLTLADMGMTPKVHDEQDLIKGHLENQGKERESTQKYLEKVEENQNILLGLINNSRPLPPANSDTDHAQVVDDG